MKKLCALFLAVAMTLSLAACGTSGSSADKNDYATSLFGGEVMTVDITVNAEAWASLLENATSKPTVDATVAINGETYKNVAVKTKGNTSLTQVAQSDSNRFSLKLSFDKTNKSQTCHGLDKLDLNNIYGDTTYLKEYMSYALFQYMEVPSSLCTFAEVKVNGEHYGFCRAVEDVDESYLERNYGSDFSGQAYKPESMDMAGGKGGMKNDQKSDKAERSDASQKTGAQSDGAQNAAPSGMPEPDGTPPAMPSQNGNVSGQMPPSQNMEDQHANGGQAPSGMPDFGGQGGPGGMWQNNGGGGMNGASGGVSLVYSDDSVDSYSNIFDNAITDPGTSDKTRLISSLKAISEGKDQEKYIDVDEVLRYAAVNVFLVNLDSYFSNMAHNYILVEQSGTLSMLPWDYNLSFGTHQLSSASNAVNYAIDTVFDGVEASERPIIGKLLENETYMAKYHEYLQQLCDYVTSGKFDALVDKEASLIDSYVQNDTTAFTTYGEFKTGVTALKTFAKLRSESVSGQLSGSIPSTTDAQKDSTALVDASALDLSALGSMTNGKGGNGGSPGWRNAPNDKQGAAAPGTSQSTEQKKAAQSPSPSA